MPSPIGIRCPTCHQPISPEEINITEGVGLCHTCDKLWRLRELAADPEDAAAKLAATDSPPSGCRIRDLGSHTVITVSCRGALGCFFLFFATFWNSIVSFFLCAALGGLYTNLVGPLPTWYPGANTQIQSGSQTATPNTMPLGMVIGLLCFLIPFVLVGIGTAIAAIMGLVGRVTITLRGQEATAFTGVGPIGWRRRFDASSVRTVRIRESGSSTNDQPNKHIVIEADKTVKIGLLLSDKRRRWLAGVLSRVLIPN